MDAYWNWAVAGLATALTLTIPSVATAASAERAAGRLIVLGDLGGGRSSYARGINDRGDIIGVSLSKNTGAYAPALWRHGRIKPIELGVRDGSPEAINNNGVVVGSSDGNRLFVWRHGRTRYFQHPGQDDGIWAADINDRAQVVGSTYNSNTFSGSAFVWDRGVFTNLPTPTGSRSGATAINNRGQILGWVRNLTTYTNRAAVWSPQGSSKRPNWKRIDLGSLGGANSVPTDINEKGQVIGSSDVPGEWMPHPFLWQNGKMIDLLGDYPAENGAAHAINDAGLVVGHIQVSMELVFQAVIWKDGRLIDISSAGYNSEALAVNNRGQVAGLSYRVREDQIVNREAFRWDSGSTKLFAPPYPAANVGIVGVDAAGRIAASIITDDEAIILRSIG
jgi:probable HAF family extracellular repeat protein